MDQGEHGELLLLLALPPALLLPGAGRAARRLRAHLAGLQDGSEDSCQAFYDVSGAKKAGGEFQLLHSKASMCTLALVPPAVGAAPG